jgi:hypothetical protein
MSEYMENSAARQLNPIPMAQGLLKSADIAPVEKGGIRYAQVPEVIAGTHLVDFSVPASHASSADDYVVVRETAQSDVAFQNGYGRPILGTAIHQQ